VSPAIDQSELAAIVGPSGSGTTTLLQLMATLGQDRPGGRVQADGQLAGEQGALLISGRAEAVAAVRLHAQHRAARGGGRLEAHPSARPPNAARLRCRNPGHNKIQSPYERAESADRDGTFDLPKAETSPRRLGRCDPGGQRGKRFSR
jgi:energy-coupling factor transporter ATP-binding protein EcfA2